VNGIPGGTSSIGRVDSEDVFHTPNTLPDPPEVTVRVVSEKDTTKTAVCQVSMVPRVKVEAEDRIAEHDRGGDDIVTVDQSHQGASGGFAVEGLDRMLEWIEIPIHFAYSGNYTVDFRQASYAPIRTRISLTTPDGKSSEPFWMVRIIYGGCG
jgi:hypothetical protein